MVIRDVTRSRKMAHVIEHRAQHDSLTNLLNRHAFDKQLNEVSRGKDYEHTLCYIDLDQFKIVNDTCGHLAGDELLRQLSAKLIDKMRDKDILARLGGDEFGVLIKDCNPKDALKIAAQLHQCITEHSFPWQENNFKLGVSIGLASINPNTSPTLAMQQADAACFMAKELGRNRTHIHALDDDQMAQAHGQMSWVPRLQKALQKNQFVLFAQAITDLQHEKDSPIHYEVLIRLKEGETIIPPGAFLPAAERYNLSVQIDKWVINKALEILSNNARFLNKEDIFNLNLSAQSINDEGFLDFIKEQFLIYDIDPSLICFEITETSAIANLTSAHAFIIQLKSMGCKFALDDFGTGLSSFGYLKNFPVDYLKIDGSFIKDIANDPIDEAMVKSIHDIGKIMGKKTVAEWVDCQEIVDSLKKIGVDYAQGYHFSKPQPFDNILSTRAQLK
jgi:diguanylate cyclase (GGDEF)-like protein